MPATHVGAQIAIVEKIQREAGASLLASERSPHHPQVPGGRPLLPRFIAGQIGGVAA